MGALYGLVCLFDLGRPVAMETCSTVFALCTEVSLLLVDEGKLSLLFKRLLPISHKPFLERVTQSKDITFIEIFL